MAQAFRRYVWCVSSNWKVAMLPEMGGRWGFLPNASGCRTARIRRKSLQASAPRRGGQVTLLCITYPNTQFHPNRGSGFSSQRLVNGLLSQRRHHHIALRVRMQPVVGKFALQKSLVVRHCWEVIEINVTML